MVHLRLIFLVLIVNAGMKYVLALYMKSVNPVSTWIIYGEWHLAWTTRSLSRVEATAARQARFDHALEHGVESIVLNSLQDLKEAGFKLALISNASSPEVQAWPRSPLAELFDVTVFSCETGLCKPEIDIYHHTLNGLDEQAENCLFIGDGGSEEHFGAAEAGINPILLSHYLDDEDTQQRLDKYQSVISHHLESMEELLTLLNVNSC